VNFEGLFGALFGLFLAAIIILTFSGCAQVTNHIYADNGATVNVTATVDKESAIEALRGAKAALY